MQMSTRSNNIPERLSSLETSVHSLSVSVQHIADSVDTLRNSMAHQARPQWGNLIAAVGMTVTIIGAVGASYVNPIQVNLKNQQSIVESLIGRVGTNEDRLRVTEQETLVGNKVLTDRVDVLNERLDDVAKTGSSSARERLAVLEAVVDDMRATKIKVTP